MDYTIKRSNRKTISIEVFPDTIIVHAPMDVTDSVIESIVNDKAEDIKKILVAPRQKKSRSIPPELRPRHDAIAALISSFCDEHLDEEYKGLCLHALDKLARYHILSGGKDGMWAAGIVYAIAQNNELLNGRRAFFLGQREYSMSAELISTAFGVSKGGMSAKAKMIKDELQISHKREWLAQKQAEGHQSWRDFNRALNMAVEKG